MLIALTAFVGKYVGLTVGNFVGSNDVDGEMDGCPVGMVLGVDDGVVVGYSVGSNEIDGVNEGCIDGLALAMGVGNKDGADEAVKLGCPDVVGLYDGGFVGVMLMEGTCEGAKLLKSDGANDGDWLRTAYSVVVVVVGDKVARLGPLLTSGVKSTGLFSVSLSLERREPWK